MFTALWVKLKACPQPACTALEACIHIQTFDSGSANVGQPADLARLMIDTKVVGPFIRSRVKQTDLRAGLRIVGNQEVGFCKVTGPTCECKIVTFV